MRQLALQTAARLLGIALLTPQRSQLLGHHRPLPLGRLQRQTSRRRGRRLTRHQLSGWRLARRPINQKSMLTELGVQSLRTGQQLLVRAMLHHLPAVEHINTMRMPHGAQSVGNDKTRPPLHQAVERLLNLPLGFGIDAGRRFIEQENRRVFQQGARDADALFFTHAEPHAALADFGFQLLGQALDKFFGISCL